MKGGHILFGIKVLKIILLKLMEQNSGLSQFNVTEFIL